ALVEAEQPLASVTVKVYVPATKPLRSSSSSCPAGITPSLVVQRKVKDPLPLLTVASILPSSEGPSSSLQVISVPTEETPNKEGASIAISSDFSPQPESLITYV